MDVEPAEELEQAFRQLDIANSRMLDGDCSLWKELLSHRDDVTLFGAYGGSVRGWEDVAARFERTAAGYAGGGGQTTSANITRWVGADLACTVDLERHETRLDGKSEVVIFTYRVTHVFRREEGQWRVVLRHADPLVTFRGSEFAHAAASPKS
jgi:ketosteroid isomerase-like protein